MSPPTTIPALPENIRLRAEARPGDPERVRDLAASTAFFSPEEVVVAAELVAERLSRGPESGYEFLFAEEGETLLAWSCFGPIPMTVESWDLYWIGVAPERQGTGLGRAVLALSEDAIRRTGGRRLYVETASRPQYEPTRHFYERCGYWQVALLEDFYAPGDGKVIYLKVL